MWIRKPKYKVINNLPAIRHHDQLPDDAIEIGRLYDPLENDTWVFAKHKQSLSIIDASSYQLKDGTPRYAIAQNDFPMEFLSWFSKALTEFQKPPIEGGLPPGAMTSADESVGGEMLCIQRAMAGGGGLGGYTVRNRSRCKRGNDIETEFEPHTVSWGDTFLFEDGLLDLIKKLGEEFEQGKL